MEKVCGQAECTVLQTGICMLNNDAATCPERIAENASEIEKIFSNLEVLSAPVRKPKFPNTLTLSHEDASQLMGGRHCHRVGILGVPNAGKTAFLVSLYLLISSNKLKGFEFRDSLTLRGFEQISHGVRRWSEGAPPEQMTNHTELSEDRSAGFMHLRLFHEVSQKPVDILLPDLPGEWSDSLIDHNRTDRLGFLRSVDGIWLMVDGQQLNKLPPRQKTLHRLTLLMQRLVAFLAPQVPLLTLVITRLDLGNTDESILVDLKAEAVKFGVSLTITQIASFEHEQIKAGTGIADLINSLLEIHTTQPIFWPDSTINNEERRCIAQFKDRGVEA